MRRHHRDAAVRRDGARHSKRCCRTSLIGQMLHLVAPPLQEPIILCRAPHVNPKEGKPGHRRGSSARRTGDGYVHHDSVRTPMSRPGLEHHASIERASDRRTNRTARRQSHPVACHPELVEGSLSSTVAGPVPRCGRGARGRCALERNPEPSRRTTRRIVPAGSIDDPASPDGPDKLARYGSIVIILDFAGEDILRQAQDDMGWGSSAETSYPFAAAECDVFWSRSIPIAVAMRSMSCVPSGSRPRRNW